MRNKTRKSKVTEPSRRHSVSKETFSEGATTWHPGVRLGDGAVGALCRLPRSTTRHPLGMLKQEREVANAFISQGSLSGAQGRCFPEMLRILSREVRERASSGPALVGGGWVRCLVLPPSWPWFYLEQPEKHTVMGRMFFVRCSQLHGKEAHLGPHTYAHQEQTNGSIT